jgi:hypothetical protein
MPTGPPPTTSARAGTAFSWVASRLVHTSTWSSPSIGGRTGSDPVVRITCSAVSRCPSTSTFPGPASRPLPRTTSAPFCW